MLKLPYISNQTTFSAWPKSEEKNLFTNLLIYKLIYFVKTYLQKNIYLFIFY